MNKVGHCQFPRQGNSAFRRTTSLSHHQIFDSFHYCMVSSIWTFRSVSCCQHRHRTLSGVVSVFVAGVAILNFSLTIIIDIELYLKWRQRVHQRCHHSEVFAYIVYYYSYCQDWRQHRQRTLSEVVNAFIGYIISIHTAEDISSLKFGEDWLEYLNSHSFVILSFDFENINIDAIYLFESQIEIFMLAYDIAIFVKFIPSNVIVSNALLDIC